ncbi:ATP phosphoribosyltransferase [Ornithinimicrobium humiphilum]|uniref:ATP phosphoribosyltransferase n=1 Tax=Ornithinimicrobium humiphilum TaxID=125288 RepID=A0A543KNU6_9MICO|nr:ATP phosphoribosyltransferase [Ornithinimicrobium humiphilum]TQM96748.1 ATP phosphoribosyltransferase (homohexameric) [Ornithinimicrobium humiphilum]
MTPPVQPRERLRVAIQKSGRLGEPARELLASCGLTWRESRDKLFLYGESLPVDILLVRDDDIPGLIADGVCDLGIVGRNVLVEHGLEREAQGRPADLNEWRQLGWGTCRLDIAIPESEEWTGPQQLEGLRIATSYPQTLGRWLRDNGVDAEPVVLNGSVEIAPRLGQADVVCDLVSTGGTLRANQLRPVTTILHSEAVIAGPRATLDDGRQEIADLLVRRLDGALQLKESRLLMLRVSRDGLTDLLPLLPEGHEPTVMRVDDRDEVSVQVLVHGSVSWSKLEQLKHAGAHNLMVLPVEGMLA